MDPSYRIVTAQPEHVASLAAIELAAAALLRGHAPESVLQAVTPEADLRAAQADGRLWVALAGERPVGFALVEMLADDLPHLEEIDVHPEHGRRGIGTALVRTVCEWAARSGHRELTLSTFRDVPWNMPFYARLGFVEIPAGDMRSELAAAAQEEAECGLDPDRRVVMGHRLPRAPLPGVDLALARRLERAEALCGVAHVEARRHLDSQAEGAWIEVAGAHAIFDGVSSPLSQTFGLAVFDPVGERELDRLEAFFSERGSPTSHEISAFASPNLWSLLGTRGYTPIETSTVLVGPTVKAAPAAPGPLVVRVIGDDAAEARLWTRTAAEGWRSESDELAAVLHALGPIITRTPGVHCLLAELKGEPVAAAILNISNGVAILGGASTIANARRQGAQAALLRARLDLAAARGVDLAMVVAQPGSASQRNAIRQGFRPAYVRSKWQRATAARVG